MSNECTNFAHLTEKFKLHNEVVEHFLISTCFLQLQKRDQQNQNASSLKHNYTFEQMWDIGPIISSGQINQITPFLTSV